MTVISSMIQFIRKAALYNRHELAPPRVILWPDAERLWAEVIDLLRANHPALWSLGDYDPEMARGPAAWLRYQLETQGGDNVPVIYLPGIGRAAFRSGEQCTNSVRHLFALQFQGQFWTQKNGKDWTPFAFFSSPVGGMGLDVAGDQDTKRAIQEGLPYLMEIEVASLNGRRLEAGDFRAIVTKDPVRTLLRWMGDPVKIRAELEKSGAEWVSFCAVCRDTFGFNPEKDGAITAAEKLSSGKASWQLAWRRYKEAPRSYSGVKDLLETLPPQQLPMFEAAGEYRASEYRPKSNRQEEERLERDICALSSASQKDALAKIPSLADEHAPRALWVWATLGESPLAIAIGYLKNLAEFIEASGNPTTCEALAEYYATVGWKADWSVLKALDAARSSAATKAVAVAIRAIYLPWLEKFATLIQGMAESYPVADPQTCRMLPFEEGTVYLFADGLRLDVGRKLEARLIASGLEVQFAHTWSALPTVTATAKPAWRPLADKLGGPLKGAGFESKEKDSGKALTHGRFKELLSDLGMLFLESDQVGSGTGCAWTELGFLDTYGHDQGAKLAWRVKEELAALEQRIGDLLQAGWATVKVITDHGWLLMPGGLPKAELKKHLTESRWGRCAIPGVGAHHGFPVTPWFWDAAEAVVLAPGISCFVAGREYAHGGLTLQEALIPCLTVSAGGTGSGGAVVLKEMKWAGMRLKVVFEGVEGCNVDIRSKVADAETSFLARPTTAAADGEKTSMLVENDEALGAAAFLVVVDPYGQPIFKQSVVIGEE